jgi:hypothetical protein
MKDRPLPSITSFIIRFVEDTPPPPASGVRYRGLIRHIQSDQELSFVHWQDALSFMANYVPHLNDETEAENSDQ